MASRVPGRVPVFGLLAVLAAGLVGAPAASAADPTPTPPPPATKQPRFLERPTNQPRVATPLVAATGFQDQTVLSGLVNPTSVAFAPDGRVFVAEKRGRIQVFDSVDDPTPTQFASFESEVYNYWDRGLLGMTLSPNFGSGPSYVYASYTYDHALGDPPGPKWNDTCPDPLGPGCLASARLVRFPVGSNGLGGTEQVLVEDWCQQYPSHSIGDLAFGPDGYLYASGGEAASFGGLDYGQLGGNPCADPLDEGGSLRAQSSRRPANEPRSLDGTLIRIDPATGLGAPSNPNGGSGNVNVARIVSYGFRNPFRFTFRPGTSDIWLGDVGDTRKEEINVIATPPSSLRNYAWPCYEGAARHPGWDAADKPLCESLYAAGPTAVVAPYYEYTHGVTVADETCSPNNGSVVSGLAFYAGGPYPAAYDGALFFADHSRNCIWAMLPATPGGLPSTSNIRTLVNGAANPVDLQIGPNGDLFYVDFEGGTIHRVVSLSSNTPPTAVATASPTSGTAPLRVQFDGSGSSDPDGAIRYDWDFGDGSAHATTTRPVHTYVAGSYTATLTVTDDNGATGTDTVQISAGNSAPVPSIDTPSPALTWVVGQPITFTGSAMDAESGPLAASRLSWRLIIDHCVLDAGCHQHIVQTWAGVSGGSFNAPDHPYPSHLELELTATDPNGASATTTIELQPKTVDLTFTSTPSGASITVGVSTSVTPFTRTVIVGSRNTVVAPTSDTAGGEAVTFVGWSDGGARIHDIIAPATPASFNARFDPDEAADTCATAAPLPVNQTVSENIDVPGDVDWYTVNVPSATYVWPVLGRLDADLRLDLYGACSTLVASSSRGGMAYEALYRKLAAGTYHVKISGATSAITTNAPYTFRFTTLRERVQVLSWSSWSSGGRVTVVGSVLNNTAGYRKSVVVTATMYNATFQPIGSVQAAVYATVLNPRTMAPFRLTFTAPPGYSHVLLSVTSAATTSKALGGLAVTIDSQAVDSVGRLHIRGHLRNANTFTVRSLNVALALFDGSAVVRNALRVTPAATTLGAGRTTTFDAIFADHYDTLNTLSVRANGAR